MADEPDAAAPYWFTQIGELLGAKWQDYDSYEDGTRAVINTINELAQVVYISGTIGTTLVCLLLLPDTRIQQTGVWWRRCTGRSKWGMFIAPLVLMLGFTFATGDWGWGFLVFTLSVAVAAILVGNTSSSTQTPDSDR